MNNLGSSNILRRPAPATTTSPWPQRRVRQSCFSSHGFLCGFCDAESGLKVMGEPDSPAVDPAIACVTGQGSIPKRGDIVELDFHVRVEEPTHAGGAIVQDAPVDAVVIEIEVVVAHAD